MKNDYPKLRAFLRELPDQAAQEAFATQCGTTLNYLRKAMSKNAKVDAALVEKIVVNSGFKVPPEELRPDVDWTVFAYDHGIREAAPPMKKAAKSSTKTVPRKKGGPLSRKKGPLRAPRSSAPAAVAVPMS